LGFFISRTTESTESPEEEKANNPRKKNANPFGFFCFGINFSVFSVISVVKILYE